MKFTITITSTLGTVARDFTMRIGAPTGTAAPVVYSKSGLSVSIPNATPPGVSDSMTITDDFEIADLNFRVDSILHTATGDVTVGLKGPTGYGTDLISATSGLVPLGGSGDHFTGTVIDDSAPAELVTAPNAAAPFTGSWKPMCNSPSMSTVDLPPDPVGQLSRFNGTSTAGIWTVRVSDQAKFVNAAGTLVGWSLIVTPRIFTCTPFTPTAAEVSVSGRVLNAGGFGIPKAIVTLTDGTGFTRTALTNMFGYYFFDNVGVGQNYILNAAAKRHRFEPWVLNVSADIADADIIAN